jgi:hypothetical protein
MFDNEPEHLTPLFKRLLLAFAAYFVVGAYYNYSTYGARGADLIPYIYILSCACPKLTSYGQSSRLLERSTLHAQ